MITDKYQPTTSYYSRRCRDHRNGRIALGVLIVLIGAALLGRRLGLFFLPFHIWPLVLVAIGIFSGIKHQFRNFGSWALITLGVLFMIPRFLVFGVMSTHLVGPILLVILGIYVIAKPRRRFWKDNHDAPIAMDEDMIHLDVTFGERSSVVTSKNFKGGIVSNTFGETRINLLQADSIEPMVLDLKVSFGSVEILVPSHWDVEFQINNSFASVEDKRYMRVVTTDDKRTLILKGSCSFGSVVVKSI